MHIIHYKVEKLADVKEHSKVNNADKYRIIIIIIIIIWKMCTHT